MVTPKKQDARFARSIRCRARKTVRAPAFSSPDQIHSRNDTLRGSMRSADQKRKLADPMLVGMAGGAQRNGIAIARFHAHTTIGSGPHMRGL